MYQEPNIFEDDAFSLTTMTDAINNIDHVPDRAGQLVFAGVGEGVATLKVSVESIGQELSLIQSSPRGAPAERGLGDKRKLRGFDIPQIKLEDTIQAHARQRPSFWRSGD